MSEAPQLRIPELEEFKDQADQHELNDIQSESYSVMNRNNSNVNSIYKMITFRSNNNKSLYILMIGILGTIAMIICISLATTTSTSIISDSNRGLLKSASAEEPATVTTSEATIKEPAAAITSESTTGESGSQTTLESTAITAPPQPVPEIDIQSLLAEVIEGSIDDKVLGTLLGSAIGDALGLPLEFWFGVLRLELPGLTHRKIGGQLFQIWEDKEHETPYENAQHEYEHQVVPLAMQMKGGGFFNAKPGQSSDDTAVAMQMARGFIATGKTEDDAANIQDIQKNNFNHYYAWTNPVLSTVSSYVNIRNRPFDIGLTFREIFKKDVTLEQVLEKTKESNTKSYDKYGSGTWSNGALMRVAPMAVYCLHLSVEDVYKVVEADMALTNNNPFVTMAVTTYVLMARELIKGGTPRTAFEKAKSFLQKMEPSDTEDLIKDNKEKPSTVVLRWINEIRDDNKDPKHCAEKPEFTIETGFKQGIYYLNDADWSSAPQPDTTEQADSSGEADGSAEADGSEEGDGSEGNIVSHKPNFEIAMKKILLEKGDTDTNAAIWGILGGAQLGIHGLHKLHPDWLETLLSCSVDPHPRVIDGKTSVLKNELEADHNPNLAKQYILQDIWRKLIQVAPKTIIVPTSEDSAQNVASTANSDGKENKYKDQLRNDPIESPPNSKTNPTSEEAMNARSEHLPPVISSTADGHPKNHFKNLVTSGRRRSQTI